MSSPKIKEFNKAPGQQWIIVVWSANFIGYILNQIRYPDELLMGRCLTPSAKAFKTKEEAYKYVKKFGLDNVTNFAIEDFVQEMKNLIRTGNIKMMVNEPYVRITCQGKEKMYICFDMPTGKVFADQSHRLALLQTLSEAKSTIREISGQKEDRYTDYKIESL